MSCLKLKEFISHQSSFFLSFPARCINWNVYFHNSLWCLKRPSWNLSRHQKEEWKLKFKLIFSFITGLRWEGLKLWCTSGRTNFTLFKVRLKVTSFLNKPAVLITNIYILQWCCNDFNGFSEFWAWSSESIDIIAK